MTPFDRRHKWGELVTDANYRRTRTCRVCGRTDTLESVVPDAFIDELVRVAVRPNPYRALFR